MLLVIQVVVWFQANINQNATRLTTTQSQLDT